MTGLPWFRFRAADFIGGTAGMTMEERGAYITLLCHQWMHGPLPCSDGDLQRVCGGVTVSERVTTKFRNVEGTQTLINDKLEEDRAHALSERAGSKNRKKKHDQKKRKRNALQDRYETVTAAHGSTSNITEGNKDIPEVEKTNSPKEVAERIWKHYPHKAGRLRAMNYIQRDLKAGTLEQDMISGIIRYIAFIAAEHARGFARGYKDGGAFFNDRMWEAEWKIVATGQSVQPGGMNEHRTYNEAASRAHTEYHIKALGIE